MPSKSIHSYYPALTGGGGGAGTTVPTYTYNEALHIRDARIFGWTRNEALHIRDADVFGWTRDEALHIRDAYSLTAAPTYDDHLRLIDAFSMQLTSLIVGRSGTPDTDQISDAYADQLAANAGTNFGNASLQAKGASTAPGSDQKIAWIQVDLTKVTGVTAGAAGGSITFKASTSNLLIATALTVGFAVQASRWFTESTMTWNTGRPTPTTTALTGPSVATGAAASYTVTFTQAQLDTMIGKWVIFQFTTAGGALPDTVTILSRDDATASNRPSFTAAFKLP